ncbi:MAG: redoxin domain-containing protein [Calditrichota bacterium]
MLSDADQKVSKAYGVYNSSGVNSRVSFIISQEKEIVRVYSEQRIKSHVEEMYSNIRNTLID